MLNRFFHDEQAATAVEYGLIAALVALAALTGFQALGTATENLFTGSGSDVSEVIN